MKNHSFRRLLLAFLLLPVIAVLGVDTLADTRDWNAILIPASLSRDTTIKLIGGHTQMLLLALQAKEAIRKRSAEQEIGLEWDLPQDMRLVSNNGVFKQLVSESHRTPGRSIFSSVFRANSGDLLGNPGERIKSDWQHQSFFVSVPSAIPEENAYIALTLRDQDQTYHWRWPLNISHLNPTKVHPKLTTIGLWDYGFYRAGTAGDGIAAFFKDVGINFIQRASDKPFLEALNKRSILTGGYTHHAAFASTSTTNVQVSGEALPGNFACPQASLDQSPKASILAVEQLAKNALQGNGMAVVDYEPIGLNGFCDQAINKFKEEYQISTAQFDSFRYSFSREKFQIHQSNAPEIRAIYEKWKQFNSQQTSAYIKQIRDTLKKEYPNVRLGLTTGRSHSANPESVSALGNDNSMLADNVDVIMPQLYFGYNGANVKLLMKYTQGWRETMDARKVKAQLWPLLLIRYPGLNEAQPPLRVRQQLLGALASGAQGVVIYAPSNMEADHWITLADTMKDIAAYEGFYHHGRRADELFNLRQMPKNQAVQNVWPDYKEIIDGPSWAFTAHEWQGNYLLTLFNLGEQGDLEFDLADMPRLTVIKSENATQKSDSSWRVPAGHIGFVTLSKQ
ncbi:MAG: hypothetical protein V9G63_02625 [Candidatus Competibacter sp.]